GAETSAFAATAPPATTSAVSATSAATQICVRLRMEKTASLSWWGREGTHPAENPPRAQVCQYLAGQFMPIFGSRHATIFVAQPFEAWKPPRQQEPIEACGRSRSTGGKHAVKTREQN